MMRENDQRGRVSRWVTDESALGWRVMLMPEDDTDASLQVTVLPVEFRNGWPVALHMNGAMRVLTSDDVRTLRGVLDRALAEGGA